MSFYCSFTDLPGSAAEKRSQPHPASKIQDQKDIMTPDNNKHTDWIKTWSLQLYVVRSNAFPLTEGFWVYWTFWNVLSRIH